MAANANESPAGMGRAQGGVNAAMIAIYSDQEFHAEAFPAA